MSTHLRKIDEAEPLWTASFFINFALLGRTLRPKLFIIRRTAMDNRKIKNQLKIYLTDKEKNFFEKKVKLPNCKTMSHFLRKCVLEKEIYVVHL